MKSIVEEALSREGAVRSTISSPPNMAEDAQVDSELETILSKMKTDIKIFGCGGAGCNTINRIVEEGIVGAELYAANTDAQHLLTVKSQRKILLGRRTTRGLGAGALPQIGEEAAREEEDAVKEMLKGADVVFITCGLGGGTGTGASGVIAKIAKDVGALTVAFVTLPFKGEGRQRMDNAEWGLGRLRGWADTVITVPNDKLLEIVPRMPLDGAFRVADEVLMRSIKGLTEVITKPGLVNLDFNDVKTIMRGAGVAMIGLGESNAIGEERALEALNEAIGSPLLDVDVGTANGVLLNVVGGNDMSVSEAERVVEEIQSKVKPTARIIWGASVDPTLEHTLKVMIIATGVTSKQILKAESGERSKLGLEMIQ